MKHLLAFSYLIFILIGCTSQQEKAATSVDSISVAPKSQDSVTAKTFAAINDLLYNAIVNGKLGPVAEQNEAGYYVLDLTSYQEFLKHDKIFSDEFFEREKLRMKSCATDLEQLKFKGEPEEGWAPESCFFDFEYWLRSQEVPNGYEIDSLQADADTASARMSFFFEHENKKSYWNDPHLHIHYRKEDGDWKITQIDRLPED